MSSSTAAASRLLPGSRLGPYEVVSLLGAGGMGEVYKARDTRLDRPVALKVLREPVASDPVLHGRFEREAKAISALQHPNICALHDVGEQGGVRFLVMEYLDGESLASRLEKGPLPLEQVLEVGVQLADALSRAHREGIVHRDLKPANVMLTRAGAKLLDFGLARAPEVVRGPLGETTDVALTAVGSRPGTYPYMAPEQLQDAAFDHRADIWALGCVLYEMASGRRAFSGATPSELMRAILSADIPRLASAVPDVPAALDHVVRICLERAPEARWQSAADVARELVWIREGSAPRRAGPVPDAPRTVPLASVVVALAFVAAGLAAFAAWRGAQPAPMPSLRLSMLAPAGFTLPTQAGCVAVSPDGRRIVFAARDVSGSTQLYQRTLEAGEATPIAGTTGGAQPFWSPDGLSVGFFGSSALQRVPLAGGSPETVTPTPFLFGAAWGADDVVIAAPQLQGPLSMWRRGATQPEPATTLDAARGERSHRWPTFLPGGRRFLYTSTRLDPASGLLESEIYVQTVGARDRTRLARAASNAVFVEPGWLLWALEGTVVAQRMDPRTLELSGEPAVVARGVVYDANLSVGVFAAGGGVLAFAPGALVGLSRLVHLDRSGRELGSAGDAGDFWTPRVAPGGDRVAVERIDPRTGNRDVYLHAADGSRPPVRLTFDAGDEFTPVWSPDGRRLAYSVRRGDTWSMRVRDVGGELPEAALAWSEAGFPTDWTSRGLYVNRTLSTANVDVVLLREDGSRQDVAATAAVERDAVLSPDGRLIAFVVASSGRPDVYVQSVASGARWQVSTDGGRQPRWSRDGRELYFVTPNGRLAAVAADGAGDFRGQVPRELFPLRLRRTEIAQYDVRPDGTFLANVEAGAESHPAISIVTGLSSALR